MVEWATTTYARGPLSLSDGLSDHLLCMESITDPRHRPGKAIDFLKKQVCGAKRLYSTYSDFPINLT